MRLLKKRLVFFVLLIVSNCNISTATSGVDNANDISKMPIGNAQDISSPVVLLSMDLKGTKYEISKVITDINDYHSNPDGWKCYKSSLLLTVSKNGNKNTYTVDSDIYLDEAASHHGGQRPCLLLDFNANKMFIFINSKDEQPYYSMDGYAFVSSMSNVQFTKETVFSGANWGWFPYFTDYQEGQPILNFFSYAGYYTILATRKADGNWELTRYQKISPEDADNDSAVNGYVLVVGSPSSDVILGDANGDGNVTVADYTAIAHYIMDDPPANFNENAADANGDGKINVADYTAAAHLILYGSLEKPENAKSFETQFETNTTIIQQ